MRRMFFRNVGGVHQLEVADDEDLAKIDRVDPARWAATSAPLKDLSCDPAFLAFLDAGGTGRLRVKQLVAARDWLFERLKHRKRIRDRSSTLVVADLDDSREPGQKLKKAVEHVLAQVREAKPAEPQATPVEKPLMDRLSLTQIRDFRASYAKTLLNGDGIVSPDHMTDPAVAAFAKDVMATIGSAKDASGLPGVGEAELTKFLERAKVFLEWRTRPTTSPAILVWGDETTAAADLVRSLDAKVEEFFLHCDLLRQDSLAASSRLSVEEMRALKAKDMAAVEAYLAGSPLAAPNPEGILALDGPVNLIYQDRFASLRSTVLGRSLGPEVHSLTRHSWKQVKATFEAVYAWQLEKPAEPFDKLDAAALESVVAGPLPVQLQALIALDKAAAGELAELVTIEKFMLYQRWLLDLVNNFVNLSAVYHPSHDALMERGSLVIDGRRLEFCLKVENRDAHKKIAAESLLFLVYATVTEKDTAGGTTFEVIAPLTSGERGRLRAGKRGLFIDNDGKEWDAVISEVVENPISIREAFKAPFRRMKEFVASKIEELASKHLKMAETSAAETTTTPAPTPAQIAAPAAAGAAVGGAAGAGAAGQGLQNILLMGGLVATALTAALGYVVSVFHDIHIFSLLWKVGLVALIIGGLSSFLGWLKLRRRDMSLILEANGWALNMPMKVTRRAGGLFAHTPRLPKGAKRQRIPMGGSARFWRIFAVVLVGLVVLGVYTQRWLRKDKGRNFDRVVDYARDRYSDVEHRLHWVQKRFESIFTDLAPVSSIALPGEGILGYPYADGGSRYLYVPHVKKIDVIDMDEDEKISEIKIREAKEQTIDARGIAIAEVPKTLPDGTEVQDGGARMGFVISVAAKTIVAFSLDTFRAAHEIPTKHSPNSILAVGATSEIWSINKGSITCAKLAGLAGPPLTIDVGAQLRFAAELNDHVYVTALDRNQIAVVDPHEHAVVKWYDTAPGERPDGINVDRVHGLLFVSCKNKKLLALSAATGKVVETWDIGADADMVVFDSGKVFVACGDGHAYFADVIDEKSFGPMKPIETAPAAKHCAVDPKTHKLYVTAPPLPAPPAGKPAKPADSGEDANSACVLVRTPWVGTGTD
jgi:hypothetical protein